MCNEKTKCKNCGSSDWDYTYGRDGPEECYYNQCGADLTKPGAIV